MNAFSIDFLKGKSTVTIRRPGNIVLMPPRDLLHTQSAINTLIEQIKGLDGEMEVYIKHTEKYYEPIAAQLSDTGIFIGTIKPKLIKDFRDNSLRSPKTDKAYLKKITRYTLNRYRS